MHIGSTLTPEDIKPELVPLLRKGNSQNSSYLKDQDEIDKGMFDWRFKQGSVNHHEWPNIIETNFRAEYAAGHAEYKQALLIQLLNQED